MASGGAAPLDRRLLAGAARFCLGLAVLLLLVIVAAVVAQVVARNLFDLGLPWADELARFAGIALVYLAVPHLLLQGQHIAVELLAGLLRGWPARLRAALSELAVLAFCGLTLFGFARFLARAARFATPVMGLPNLLFYLPALIGIALLALVALHRLVRSLRAPAEGEPA